MAGKGKAKGGKSGGFREGAGAKTKYTLEEKLSLGLRLTEKQKAEAIAAGLIKSTKRKTLRGRAAQKARLDAVAEIKRRRERDASGPGTCTCSCGMQSAPVPAPAGVGLPNDHDEDVLLFGDGNEAGYTFGYPNGKKLLKTGEII